MKIAITLTIALYVMALVPAAQGQLLKKWNDRLNEKISERTERKADQAMDKSLDQTEEHVDQVTKKAVSSEAPKVKTAPGGHARGDCGHYYLLMNKAEVEMTVYDKDDQPSMRINYHITGVKSTLEGREAQVQIEAFDEKGNRVSSGSAVYKCVNGSLLMDMRASMPYQSPEQQSQIQATGEEAFLEYPAEMKVGEALPDGGFHLEMKEQGSPFTAVDYTASNRKVEARETVTTPAGTWDCFRISYTATMRIEEMIIGIPMRYQVTEWYMPGFGIVKSLSRNKKGKIAGYSRLTKIQYVN